MLLKALVSAAILRIDTASLSIQERSKLNPPVFHDPLKFARDVPPVVLVVCVDFRLHVRKQALRSRQRIGRDYVLKEIFTGRRALNIT